MSENRINYEEVQRLYELCTQGTDLREFCKDCGVKYDRFLSWQRHQLWNEKLGRTESPSLPRMSSIKITDAPQVSQSPQKEVQPLQSEMKIPSIQITFQKGVQVSLSDITVDGIHTILTKLTGILC